MLALSEIEKFYPAALRGYKQFILREYLQYKILQIIYESEYSSSMLFLGGTCLRVVHGNSRFSEDLDFDNLQMEEAIFQKVSDVIKNELSREGYLVEMKVVFKGAYHCHIRFPEILYKEGLSGHSEQKILIQLDTEPQNFSYTPERFILNRFDVFTSILVTPKELLLSQKFYAVLNRPRNKGRDFFDIVFLLSLINKPDYEYLEMKTGITNSADLKKRVLLRCSEIDMAEMGRDVAPFLFNHRDINKVTLFTDFLQQFRLE